MFESIINFFKKLNKKDKKVDNNSKTAAKERLHLVLMQDRANVSADFLELMKQEIIEVIKKYIDVDESAIDVRLTNKENEDGTNGAPALYANIPILNIKNEKIKGNTEKTNNKEEKNADKVESVKDEKKKTSKKEEVKEMPKEKETKQETEKENKQEKEIKKEEKSKTKKDKEELNVNKENDKEKSQKEKETTKKEAKEEIKSEN